MNDMKEKIYQGMPPVRSLTVTRIKKFGRRGGRSEKDLVKTGGDRGKRRAETEDICGGGRRVRVVQEKKRGPGGVNRERQRSAISP